MSNTSTKKEFAGVSGSPVDATRPSKRASHSGNMGGTNEGQLPAQGGPDSMFNPMGNVSAEIRGMGGTHDDIGEKSGFITDGYLDKQGTPYGEAARFNFLPPGMDISNQENAEIHTMPLRRLLPQSYPDDGWTPTPRDIPE